MYAFDSTTNYVIQGLVAVIIVGVFYNLLASTKAYGGIVGKAIRLIGIGMLFLAISSIERALVNFSIIGANTNAGLMQDILSLLSLVFLGLGFSKLASGSKA